MYTINFHIVFVLLVGALWHRNNCFSIELSRKLNMHSSAGYMTVMEEDIQPKELQHGSDSTVRTDGRVWYNPAVDNNLC